MSVQRWKIQYYTLINKSSNIFIFLYAIGLNASHDLSEYAQLDLFRVVKISQQPAHLTGYTEYCAGYSDC